MLFLLELVASLLDNISVEDMQHLARLKWNDLIVWPYLSFIHPDNTSPYFQ